MAEKKGTGIKSAVELALERLAGRGDLPAGLSPEQKKALAEVDTQVRARVAEVEILMDGKMAAARAKPDPEELQKLAEQKQAEIRRIRERGERDKDAIRKG
ncbi:MAG TPA: hypothetical protein P5567_15045 [Kiritimatiellia bacterium]|nr:hypothetical protein [Kiritimatiellia bacterium]HRZ13758.1 hypothetical protein [Kiritimatiellia bacterium]HSA19697.1 hypothetical protein [Kiritimatiellia bacterium]